MIPPMRLRGRVAAITGGALGIGRATARLFAAEGAQVAIGDVKREAAEEVAREIAAAGGQAVALEVTWATAPRCRPTSTRSWPGWAGST